MDDKRFLKHLFTVLSKGKAIDAIIDAHEAKLKTKDEEIGVAKKVAQDAYTLGTNQATEMDRFWEAFGLLDENISVDDAIAFFKTKDERIAELEIIVQKMKSCENCSSFRENYFGDNYCSLTTDEEKECQKNNYSNWQLKDKNG